MSPTIDMTNKENSAATVALRASEGPWRKAVAFLNRDVRSFLPGWQPERKQLSAESAISPDGDTNDSLADLGKLDYLAFRREVLDWRDGFHAQITQRVSDLHDAFIERIDSELDEVSLFRQLITKSAGKVLERPFNQEVRIPLIFILRLEEEKLIAYAKKWALQEQIDLTFKRRWPHLKCNCLEEIGFKPTNREAIHAKIESMMLGDTGISEIYCAQATRLARKLIEDRR